MLSYSDFKALFTYPKSSPQKRLYRFKLLLLDFENCFHCILNGNNFILICISFIVTDNHRFLHILGYGIMFELFRRSGFGKSFGVM